jgi:hypothetical protein
VCNPGTMGQLQAGLGLEAFAVWVWVESDCSLGMETACDKAMSLHRGTAQLQVELG